MVKLRDTDGNVISSGKTVSAAMKNAVKNYSYDEPFNFDLTDFSYQEIKGIDFYFNDINDIRGSKFSDNTFINCNFVCVDFLNCDIRDTTFEYCSFEYAKNIIQFGPIGEHHRIGYAVMHDSGPMIKLGCFWGTQKEAVEEIRYKYGMKSSYEAIVKAACKQLKEYGSAD